MRAWLAGLFVGIALVLCPTQGSARTWYVLPDSTGDAPTIQAAIDSSGVGDTVLVAAGLYYVNLRIYSKSGLNLVSESGPEGTILDGTYANPGEYYRKPVVDLLSSTGVRVEGFTIRNGHPQPLYTKRGAGVRLLSSSATVRGNIIRGNRNERGAAIHIEGDTGTGGTVIEGNQILENTGSHSPGAYVYWCQGPITIRGNLFSGNEGYYAGLYSEGTWLTVEGNTFRGNTSESYVVYNEYGSFLATSNVIVENGGSGIGSREGSIRHNTVVGNSEYGVSAGDCSSVQYNISATNGLDGIGVLGCSSVECNDAWGNGGSNYVFQDWNDTSANISVDPLFCAPSSGDYSLAVESPCAPENNGCGLMGALPVGCVFTEVAGRPPAPLAYILSANTPNPFNPETEIRYWTPAQGPVRLVVYDVGGRLVDILVDEHVAAGEHRAVWDGRRSTGEEAPSGAYFARLEAGGEVMTRKITLVR